MTTSNPDVGVDLSVNTPLIMDHQEQEHIVVTAVDFKGQPAVRFKHGRWLSAFFIIWVEMAERLAYYGVSANLITYLTGKLGQSTAMAAANLNAWSGVASLLPILGAVIADSFLGKFYTIIASSLIYIVGLGLLTLSATLPSLSCPDQGKGSESSTAGCSPQFQIIIFFVALYMVAAGQGGHKPCVQAFGAEQFDGEDLLERRAKSSFFNWWFFGSCIGAFVGIGVLSYVQDNLSWGLGFGIPFIVMMFSLLIFVLGIMTYRYNLKAEGKSSLSRFRRVLVMAAKNRKATSPTIGDEEEMEDTKPNHGCLKFLDKALIPPEVSKPNEKPCSKSEVDEAKAILRLFPIWTTTLIFAISYAQVATFFTKQGITLNRSIGSNFDIPAAGLQSFIAICIMIFIPFYDGLLVPIVRNWTSKPAGISMLQRIGTGLFMSTITMVVAAVVEKKRLKTASSYGLIDLPNVTIPMTIWWLLPQYALQGIAEAFTTVGLQEFFYDQVPNDMRCVGLSLYLSVYGLGGLLSSFLVSMINKVTSKGGGESWFSNNLNRAHLDYFYWLLTGLSALGLALFIYFAKSYTYNRSKFRL